MTDFGDSLFKQESVSNKPTAVKRISSFFNSLLKFSNIILIC